MLPSLLFALSLILSINQSINASITFLPRTLSAPWHARWDSNMEYINKPTNVVLTNGTSRTFPNVLMIQGDGDDGQNPTNDIWASPDKGQTWHLIAGIGRTGQAYREYAQYSFSPVLTRPATGIDNNGNVFRIGGLRNSDGIRPRDSVWMTTNGGVQWTNQGAAPNAVNFSPGRDRANIIVDSNNQLFIVGGQARNEGDVMTNTVWRSRDAGVTWEEMPHTPWQRPRGSALMLNHYSKPLGRDVLTYLTGFDGRGGNPSLYNEIWISDDSANTWKQVRTNWGSGLPPFLKRDAANGEITDKGILVLVGGQHVYPNNTYEALNDIWVSLDGGYQWGLCNEDAPFADRRDLFTAMDNNGFLYVAGGQDMTKGSRYNDVWRSSISFDNPLQVARECNVPMPACGPGIACLPGDSKTTFLSNGTVTCPAVRKCAGLPDFYLDFDVMTTKAPWTARYWMNVEYFPKTITVKTSATGTRQLVNPLIAHGGDVTTNDVWASVDSGKTWLNIAGSGSFSTTTSYWPARQFANSIVNQVTKHIIRVGGLSSSAESSVVNDVWVTSDAVTWFKQAATNLPPRQLPHLIVSDTGKLFLSGGVLANGSTAKDMWSSVDNGASWTLITETLPWNSARGRAKGMLLADRVPQLGNKDILFAGIGWDGTNMYNDIWVSSDEAVTWARVTARAPFAARDAAAYEITVDGVIIVSGGQTGPNQQNDAWVSADGGYTWGLCSAESFWSDRREPAGVIDNDGYFYIMGGRETADAGAPNFNDVFRTSMSLSNPVAVAAACNIKISPCGTGLICWPGAPGTVVTSTGVTCPALEECGPPRPKSSSSSTGRARSSSSSSTGRGVDCKKNPCHDSCPSVCDVELCGQPDPEWNPQCFEDVSSSSTGAAITTGSGLSMGVIVAIIAVIAVIVIGGGYWYYKRRNSTDPMSSASMTEMGKASAQHQNSITTSLLSDEHPTSSSSGAPAAF